MLLQFAIFFFFVNIIYLKIFTRIDLRNIDYFEYRHCLVYYECRSIKYIKIIIYIYLFIFQLFRL